MKVQYHSDLHLEFSENRYYLKENPIKPVGDILVLAGDILPFYLIDSYKRYFKGWSDQFEEVYWLPGNHEYYNSDISKRTGKLNEKIETNVTLINNDSINHDGIKFVFSTLWSAISPENHWLIQQSLSDFHVIKRDGLPFTPSDFNALHQDSLHFLNKELKSTSEKIIVTHHVPTFYNYPEKYKGDILNEAFAVELFDLIESTGSKFWIYGHHHQFIPPFQIGSTQLLTNQLGYVRNKEHHDFDDSKYLLI